MQGTAGAADIDSRPPAGRFVLPAVAPPENAPVQLMEYDKLRTGRWYIVKVGEKRYTLYLKSMHKTRGYDFYYQESGGVLAFKIYDNNDILEPVTESGTGNQQGNNMEVEGGEKGDTDKMEDKLDDVQDEGENDLSDELEDKAGDYDELITGSLASDAGAARLGIVSWNVAHFSDRDVESALEAFVKAFKGFDVGSWDRLFKNLDDFIKGVQEVLDKFRTIKKPPEDEKNKAIRVMRRLSQGRAEGKRQVTGRKLPQDKPFLDNDELREQDSDLFSRLHGDSSNMLEQLDADIKKLAEELAGYDREKLKKEIKEIAGVDWSGLWQHAKGDSGKRMELAVKVKDLRAFKTSAESTKALLKLVSDLRSNSSIQTFLERTRLAAYGALKDDELGAAPAMQSVLELDRSMHTHNIMIHLEEMFAYNGWLDIIILQEINNPALLGKDKTPGAAGGGTNKEHPEYDTYLGPQLLSAGDTPQQEYYPLLIRKSSGMEVIKVYQVSTDGEMVEAPPTINWDKGRGDYRPIVVYEVKKKGVRKPLWIGVVHTTPEADTDKRVAEWNRKLIFREVSEGLNTLRQKAAEKGIPLIVGGDYYLTAEAVVADEEGDNAVIPADNDEDMIRYKAFIDERLKVLNAEMEKLLQEEGIYLEDPRVKRLSKQIRMNEEAKQDKQLQRNIRGLTVASQVEDMGLELAQTVSGTNPKSDPLKEQEDVQIADFFIHNSTWKSNKTGLLRPQGSMVSVDTEDMAYSKYWQRFSDHFPVAAIYSLNNEDLSNHEALVTPSGTQEAADEINISRYAQYEMTKNAMKALDDSIKNAKLGAFDIYGLFDEVVDTARIVFGKYDNKTEYDFSLPAKPMDVINKIEYFRNRIAETIGTAVRSGYNPAQTRELAMRYLKTRLIDLHEQHTKLFGNSLEDASIDLIGIEELSLHELTARIEEMEGMLDVDEGDRLHVTRPEDFQPAYSAEDLVKKLKQHVAKLVTSTQVFKMPQRSSDGGAGSTVQIGQREWTVNRTGGRGNCFYNGVFEGLYGTKATGDAQQLIRNRVVNVLLINQQVITHLFGVVPRVQDINAVVEQIIQEGNWTENFTPSFVAEALNLRIVVLRPNGTVYYVASPTVAGPQTYQIYLQYDGGHYNSITREALDKMPQETDMEISK
ncbi:OTU domain-containing protein [Chitinophaga sp. YR627]|uniref:OTU domain-containing protein n=1 Tax=Chitinophaga sp. YR627 TaxID=1881041 RepID=UPI001160653B|nr:OTU domain-containing protein [Chitinophaga sp. YR627]